MDKIRVFKNFLFFLLLLLISNSIFTPIAFSSDKDLSVKVQAHASDFQLSFDSTTPYADPFPQNSTINYKITYGSNLNYGTAITLEATWSRGTIEGQGAPTVDILNYVVGSSSKAYGDTSAVIDLVNRKITWTISSFPAETTDQEVTFGLKTNSSHTGTSKVNFTVSSRLINEDVTLPYVPVNQSYLYDQTIVTPTPTPTSTPIPTTVPPNTPTPTQTSGSSGNITPGQPTSTTTTKLTPAEKKPTIPQVTNLQPLSIKNVLINNITQSLINFQVNISKAAYIYVRYGLKPGVYTNTIRMKQVTNSSSVSLNNLNPNTPYYFQVITVDKTGKQVNSETFTIKTAQISKPPAVLNKSFVIKSTNGGIILDKSKALEMEEKPAIVPQNTPYKITLNLDKYTNIKNVTVLFKNKKILGISNLQENVPNGEITLPENNAEEILGDTDFVSQAYAAETSGNGLFAANIRVPQDPGEYEIYVQIEDEFGNLIEEKIADIKVVKKMKVVDKNNRPVPGAKIIFSRFDEKKKSFEVIPTGTNGIVNPGFSEKNGDVSVTLRPDGRYKAQISHSGYSEKTVEFTIGNKKGEEYPTVVLDFVPNNIISYIQYYYGSLIDTFRLNTSEIALSTVIVLNGIILLFTVCLLLLLRRRKIVAYSFILSTKELLQFNVRPPVKILIGFLIELGIALTIIFTISSYRTSGFYKILLLGCLSLLSLSLWIMYIKILSKFKPKSKND